MNETEDAARQRAKAAAKESIATQECRHSCKWPTDFSSLSTGEYTKGPWTSRHFNQIGHCEIGSPNWASVDGEPLAILPIRRTLSADGQYKECTAASIAECEANGRLIVMSPELYDLLAEAVREYDEHGPNVVSGEWLDRVRPVLAKATGKPPKV